MEYTHINDLKTQLQNPVLSLMINDNIWTYFGYNDKPRPRVIKKLLVIIHPKLFTFEKLLSYEIFIMGLVDVIYAVMLSNKDLGDRRKLILGIIDGCFNVFDFSKTLEMNYEIIDDVVNTYNNFLNTDDSFIFSPIIKKYENLKPKDFAKLIKGFAYYSAEHTFKGGFFLDIYKIRDFINNKILKGELEFNLPEDALLSYNKLIEENVLFRNTKKNIQ